MWQRRRLPADLRGALRAAERQARRAGARRPGLLRRVPMALWLLLVFVAAVVVGEAGLAPWHPAASRLLRVVHGSPERAVPRDNPRAGRFTARASVIDGDTLASAGGRLRIHGIDAPESHQTCQRGGQPYACGRAATRAMAALVGGGALACEALDTDRYGRRVVRCRNAQGMDIGGELVRQGWAVAFTRYSMDYVAQQAEARAARRGIWEGSFDVPSDWRARQRP